MERKKNKPKIKQTKATVKPLRQIKSKNNEAEYPEIVQKAIKWVRKNHPEMVFMRKKKSYSDGLDISSIIDFDSSDEFDSFMERYPFAKFIKEIQLLSDLELYSRIEEDDDWGSDESLCVAYEFIERMRANYLMPVLRARENLMRERNKGKRDRIKSCLLKKWQIIAPTTSA